VLLAAYVLSGASASRDLLNGSRVNQVPLVDIGPLQLFGRTYDVRRESHGESFGFVSFACCRPGRGEEGDCLLSGPLETYGSAPSGRVTFHNST
jgi:hypothetical protein